MTHFMPSWDSTPCSINVSAWKLHITIDINEMDRVVLIRYLIINIDNVVAAHHLPEPLPHLLGPDEPEPHVVGVSPRLLLHLTVGLPCITNKHLFCDFNDVNA